ncbi:MAG: DNA replication/repair protein RecF [Anaerolineae bacterium]|nr:MAG: DNA replication/repair protein RecF [Anaerolineae bacterium]
MYLTHLSLTNFRTFARLDIEIPRRVILLVGGNAQGKTSFLEAVYFLAALTSFQTHTDRHLVNFLAAREPLAVARLVGEYRRGESRHRIEVRLILEAVGTNGRRLRKEVLIDGVKRPLSEAIGHFNAVIFVPQMTQIIEGGPEERRRYLNLTLAQAIAGYASLLGEYRKALSQRNALLKQIAERGGDLAQLTFWDETLADLGAKIIHYRIHAVKELEKQATRIHHRLTRAAEVLRLDYRPSYDPLPAPQRQYALPMDTPADRSGLSPEEIRRGFLERLERLRGEEITRGVTTIGPHRDEVRFLGNGVDLGFYGSRGQIRTALLSLRLAEVSWLKEKTGQWPVILLDEVMAELDTQRRADLLDYLGESEQALLTTTDLSAFDESFVRGATVWQVEGGTVRVGG